MDEILTLLSRTFRHHIQIQILTEFSDPKPKKKKRHPFRLKRKFIGGFVYRLGL